MVSGILCDPKDREWLLLESFLTLLVIGQRWDQGQELFVAHGPHVIREEMVLRCCRDRDKGEKSFKFCKSPFSSIPTKALRTDRPTNQRTDQWTDKTSYRDARMHLKM